MNLERLLLVSCLEAQAESKEVQTASGEYLYDIMYLCRLRIHWEGGGGTEGANSRLILSTPFGSSSTIRSDPRAQ